MSASIIEVILTAKTHYGIAPLALMALAQAIPTLLNVGKAIKQGSQAKKLSQTERPQYDIPQAIQQALNSAKLQAGQSQLPGQKLAEQKLGQTTSNAIAELKNVSSNPADLATNVQRLYQGQLGQQNNLNIAAAQNQNANQAMLRNQLGQMGGYQDKQWQLNEFEPYRNDKAAEAALREGAFRNLSAAGQNVGNAIGGIGNVMYNQQMLDQLLGKGVGQYTAANGWPTANMAPQNTAQDMTGALNGAVTGVPPASNNNQNDILSQLIQFTKPKQLKAQLPNLYFPQ